MGERALMDSARSVPPKMRMEWLYQHGRMEDRRLRTEDGPATADSGLVLRGKWGRGPAAEVTGKDTLVVLTLGSEVALLSFAEPDSPRVLSEIQFPALTAQSYLEDSLLYTSSNADLEVWSISDPTQPVKRGQLIGQVGDFWIRDTFLYFIRSDTFHVISIANPANLRELGSCSEAGSVTTGSGNTVVVCQSGGFAFVDVSNPANPHQVGSYPCGRTLAATARGNLVCASYAETGYPYRPHFITLDISTPSSPQLLANRSNLGGFDIFLDGPLAFISGNDPGTEAPLPFQILSIADSAHPAFIDSLRTTNRYSYGVWENSNLNRAFVADEYDGLAIVDISNLNNPVLDTWVLKTGSAVDVHVDGNICYVAGYVSGARLLDVTDPSIPVHLSGLDTSFTDASNYSVTARDSFAFVGWRNPYLRIVSVTDPLRPRMVAACSLFSNPEDMVLHDSFVYCAEDYMFQVVNIALPRAPVVVGSCGLPDDSYEMDVRDTLAFIANSYGGLQIVNVARPDAPKVVGAWTLPNGNGAVSVAVIDTFAYTATGTLYIVSFANPASPYLIDSVALPTFGLSLVASDSLLFVGSWYGRSGGDIRLFDIRNRTHPVSVGSLTAPDGVYRMTWVAPYLLAACVDGGVLIAETAAVGVRETRGGINTRPRFSVSPNPVCDVAHVQFGSPLDGDGRLGVYDPAGRQVFVKQLRKEAASIELSLMGLSPGLYFVRVETRTGVLGSKLIKQ
jgi:hypothetical protein